MIIHTVLHCGGCKFCYWYGMYCNYHARDLKPDPRNEGWTKTIPDWCTLRNNAILVMTDPIKLRKAEEQLEEPLEVDGEE